MRLSRSITAAVVVVAALVLAGCSTGQADTQTDSSAPAATVGTFPQTVETAFGDVTIGEAPKRVVALGWGDAETALALGVQPVGASDWVQFGGDGVGPWADGLYDTSPKIIATLEPSYEAIAALEPDLILDVKGSGDQQRYDRLSEIATTVGVPKGGESYLTTTDQQMTTISTALGLPAAGDVLLAEVDSAYERAAAAHPEWTGLTVSAATKTSKGWGAYVAGGGRVETLERFGFVQSQTIADLPVNSGGFSIDLASERLDLLEADVIVAFPIFIDAAAITDDPQWTRLSAVKDGRAIVIDGDVSSAFSMGTTLSTQFTIDSLVPLFEKAAPAF